MTKAQESIVEAAQAVRSGNPVTDHQVALVREAIKPDYKTVKEAEEVPLDQAAAEVLGHFHARTGMFTPRNERDKPHDASIGGSLGPAPAGGGS